MTTITITRNGTILGTAALDADGYIADYAGFSGEDSSLLSLVARAAHASEYTAGTIQPDGVRYDWALAA